MRRCALLTGLLAVAPRAVLACPVCFGQNDSPLAAGINYGILVMLGLIVGLWAAFGSFFIYLRRRARAIRVADSSVDAVAYAPQRGTV